jgi:hypothetical protein
MAEAARARHSASHASGVYVCGRVWCGAYKSALDERHQAIYAVGEGKMHALVAELEEAERDVLLRCERGLEGGEDGAAHRERVGRVRCGPVHAPYHARVLG